MQFCSAWILKETFIGRTQRKERNPTHNSIHKKSGSLGINFTDSNPPGKEIPLFPLSWTVLNKILIKETSLKQKAIYSTGIKKSTSEEKKPGFNHAAVSRKDGQIRLLLPSPITAPGSDCRKRSMDDRSSPVIAVETNHVFQDCKNPNFGSADFLPSR